MAPCTSSILSWALAVAPPVDATTAPAPRPVGATTDVREDPCVRGKRNVCRELTIGGGTSLGLGIAGLGVGIGLAVLPNRTIADDPSYERAFRPAGLAIIPLAVVLVVSGSLLLAKAIRMQRGRRGRGGARR